MALADDYAQALGNGADDVFERKILRQALEAALKPVESVWSRIRTEGTAWAFTTYQERLNDKAGSSTK